MKRHDFGETTYVMSRNGCSLMPLQCLEVSLAYGPKVVFLKKRNSLRDLSQFIRSVFRNKSEGFVPKNSNQFESQRHNFSPCDETLWQKWLAHTVGGSPRDLLQGIVLGTSPPVCAELCSILICFDRMQT
ncbi:PREDICTED: uncharacterized protein LOC107351777 [Acropora digitifera]|uniref:uncharacterized protein LOC107351777 n=1 Tax=Acropora digitifera TaxID=70779 RepID=UPI00077A30DA|nr:PREDICTED: uncharacterized protein LOC107351777 [Acropora digitifera]